jgi:hypothetical protein
VRHHRDLVPLHEPTPKGVAESLRRLGIDGLVSSDLEKWRAPLAKALREILLRVKVGADVLRERLDEAL